jgi:two-component system, NarL family, response regulator LiaR
MDNDLSPVITILIAEDYEVNRIGLKMLFDSISDFQVVGEAPDGEKCVKLAAELKPTIVLMDVRMPILGGIEATRQIKESSPDTKIVMLTSHSNHAEVLASLEAGADGYCLKEVRSQQLTAAIRAVAGGACWLDPGVAGIVIRSSSYTPKQENSIGLTERELAVLKLIVEGLSNQEIGKRLFTGHDSIKVHVRLILEKLAVTGRTQAAIKAVKDRLV